MNVDVLLDTPDLIVVNKPINIGMHDTEKAIGIVSLLKQQLAVAQLFLCHRLDTPTSGCLLLAKNSETAATIGLEFEARQVNKLYLAMVDKKPKKKQGKIVGDMLKSRNGCYMLSKTKANPAVTQFQSFSLSANKRLLICKPLSGKTHQLRVACKSLSSPIIGDLRYKGTESDRLYLHSYMLSFKIGKEEIKVTALPTQGEFFANEILKNAFNTFRLPEHLVWPK